MPQYFGAPNGSSRSRRRIVARSHPGDAGRPAELAVWATSVGMNRQAVMVLSTNETGLSTALAVHGQVHVLGQLLGQVLHVHAGAGLTHLVTSWVLPTTVTPASETTNPRARSWSLSTPTCAPSGTTTSLSMIAFCTTALAPMRVLSMITERSTMAKSSIRAPGDSTDSRTSAPETMTPLETTLLTAWPTRSPSSCTNFAGGCGGMWVRIGHWLLYRLNTGTTAHRSMCAS